MSNDKDTLLVLELQDCWIDNAERRATDCLKKGLLGIYQPYAIVKIGNNNAKTTVVNRPTKQGGPFKFDRRMVLSLCSSSFPVTDVADVGLKTAVDEVCCDEVSIEVFDKCLLRICGRRDSLAGGSKFSLKRSELSTGFVQRHLELHRPDQCVRTALLHIQYRLLDRSALAPLGVTPTTPAVWPPAAITASQDHRLVQVAKAICEVLRQPDGVLRLVGAMPDDLLCDARALQRLEHEVLPKCFEVVEALTLVRDEKGLQQLAFVSRLLYLYILNCVPPGGDPITSIHLWIKKLFETLCAGSFKCNEDRLKTFSLASFKLASEFIRPADASGEEIALVRLRRYTHREWELGDLVCKSTGAFLGGGAYGTVWRAVDMTTGRLYAVKRMESDSGSRKKCTQREMDVAERLCLVSHPCIVRLYAVIANVERVVPVTSLIMEYCSGGTMSNYIHQEVSRQSQTGGYEPPKQWRAWLAQLVLGLEHLHLDMGMIVRDIKPCNVLITAENTAKLTDFGMSKLQCFSAGGFSFAPDVPPGSPEYVAPEVLRKTKYDRRADYYSLGVMTWVLVTGGVRSSARESTPRAPCGRLTSDFRELMKNWELVRACVEDPSKNDARPVHDAGARDFIMWLTDRAPGHFVVDHPWIRAHQLFHDLDLPERAAQTSSVEQWLRGTKRSDP